MNAHEYGDPHNIPPYTDLKIDLHNSFIGRVAGQTPLGVSWYFAFQVCKEAWNRGWLWTKRNGTIVWSDGRVVDNPPFKWY
jgi:hypothetical protein